MPRPDENHVRQVLMKNGRDIACRRAVEKAWSSVKNGYPEKAWWRRKSTRAALIWEHSVNNAIAALGDDSGVKVIPHHDTTSFIIDDGVLLRFKKASIQLHTSNYPTFLASLFHRHEKDLFGYEGLHRVELAHVFNAFETALDWIGVVAREEGQVLWHFEIGRGDSTIQTLPLPQPLSPAADRVLRPVKPEDEKTRDNTGE